ncbi:sigma-70 family RNA polymerase sigma factor [Streptomyces sp. HNM0663]|uniref:Sigma-70 family RNA polymerase sigma factor n=2 Tax=Streptomyces chengmaiensis TaxID=3040919 RepID=A0ABT6HRF7_9ACTN|nr:sigma-70 family RNA polymerase sigma factor [Streptomyces chengmaiensis]
MWSHREQLLKVARRRSMSAEDAEDAVQEAMLRAAESAHLDDARLGAWLTTVTMRLCVDRHRQVRREAQVSGAPTLSPSGPAPVEEAVCDRAEATWVAFRSRELPARQAEALRLKSEDRDVGQIAREMDLSYEAVESLLARARRTLRNSLAGTLALGLWLIGRGRDQAGQAGAPAHAVVAASAAATLAVAAGLVVPFVQDTPETRPPGSAAVRSAAPEAAPEAAAAPAPPPAPTAPQPAAAPAEGGHGASPGPSPGLAAASLPEVLPEASVPEVSPALPAVPEVPQIPQIPQIPAVPDVPEAVTVNDIADIQNVPDIPNMTQPPSVPHP